MERFQKYEVNTDDENIRLIREENDNAALEFLVKKYMGIVKKESRTLYIIGAENEDIIQEGMIGLVKAIRSYNMEKGASFSTFATLCIRRQLITAVKLSNRKKHSPLNYYVSFYADNGEEQTLADELPADRETEPEHHMFTKFEAEKIYAMIDETLSDFEKDVLREFLSGKSYEEIGASLNKPAKSVDNAIQRIRKKMRDLEK